MKGLSIENWFSIIVGFGYIAYCAYGFETEPGRKFYNRLLNNKTFVIHLFLSICVFCFGYYRCSNGQARETFYFAPFLFLIFLRFFNWLTRYGTDRDIIISTKWDYRPYNYKWYIDGFFSILIVGLPIVISGLVMNKFRFGEFFR